ncbi:hypothetical protein HZC32_02320 [Candidatus Woesearchaeota archaeon]|nr:hypothetical protein [Candidatus Woesearchaeota archaeon]
MFLYHLVTPDFRVNLEKGYLGEGDHSDAVTYVLKKAYAHCLELCGGKVREKYTDAFKEFVDDVGKSVDRPVYLIAKAINLIEKKEKLMFEEGPIKVYLYNDYQHPLGVYLDYDIRGRMVAEIKYRPFGSEEAKETGATEVNLIKIARETAK